MKKIIGIVGLIALIGSAQGQTSLERTFEGIEEIKFSISSGDISFEKSKDNSVYLSMRRDESGYEPKIEKVGDRLIIKDENRSGRWSNRGGSYWTFSVPDNLELDFNTGSGDLEMEGLTAEFKANTGSGSYRFDNVNGEFKLNTGSGDFEVNEAKGEFRVNTGSGDVDIRNCEIAIDANTGSGEIGAKSLVLAGPSGFNSGSGDVEIELAKALDHDISLNSGSGDSRLDFNGAQIEGEVVMKVNKNRGRIRAPFEFDTEEEIENGRNNVILKKTAKIGKKDILIRIGSGSGTAEITE